MSYPKWTSYQKHFIDDSNNIAIQGTAQLMSNLSYYKATTPVVYLFNYKTILIPFKLDETIPSDSLEFSFGSFLHGHFGYFHFSFYSELSSYI